MMEEITSKIIYRELIYSSNSIITNENNLFGLHIFIVRYACFLCLFLVKRFYLKQIFVVFPPSYMCLSLFCLLVYEKALSGICMVVVLPMTCISKLIVSGVVDNTVLVCLSFCLQTLKPSSVKKTHMYKSYKRHSLCSSTSYCGFIFSRFWRMCIRSGK